MTKNDLDQLSQIAQDAAKEAGVLLMKYSGKPAQVKTKASAADLVTEIDQASEEMIRKALDSHYPDFGFLGEEQGYVPSDTDYRWIVDPLDGTMNFVHGIPFFSISIGLEYKGELIMGLVYDPALKEMFAAVKGGGTTLNGERIQVSHTPTLDLSILSTGFSSHFRTQDEPYLGWFVHFERKCHAVRRMGSTALYLAYVAAGRMDGFYEMDLKSWDIAGGIVLVNEAGGMITNLNGGPVDLEDGELIASNGHIHATLISELEASRKSN